MRRKDKNSLNRRKRILYLTLAIGIIVIAAFAAGALIPESAVASDFTQKNLSPCLSHPFGTDWMGRDLFLRTLKGLSVSMTVGMVASIFSAVIVGLAGVAVGGG